MPMGRAILFDLDGTLLDSRGDIADAVNVARARLGAPPLHDDDVERFIGRGSTWLLRQTLPNPDATRIAEARTIFFEHYRAHPLDRSTPFRDADRALANFAAAGIPMGLVTNKPRQLVVRILDGLGWTSRFGVVLAGDDLPERKPSPVPLLAALDQLGAARCQTLFVGDTDVDREAAAAAGVGFVAVAWGRVAVHAARVIEAFAELSAEIAQ